jgi:hypothetical protein
VESELTQEGFKVHLKEPGLFYLTKGKCFILIALWVDDFLIAFSKELANLKEEIIRRLEPRLLLRQTFGKLLGMELVETPDAFYRQNGRIRA